MSRTTFVGRRNPAGCARPRGRFLAICFLLLAQCRIGAVSFYSTSIPSFNSTAPTGALVESGWQYEGLWGSFLGTPIGPQYFITAEHVGGSIGQSFLFNGLDFVRRP